MESIQNHSRTRPYRSNGGSHRIAVGARYDDPETPEYRHALVWKFNPTLQRGPQTPTFDCVGFVHKKYWRDIEPDIAYTHDTTDDGSEVIESHGWSDTIDVTTTPDIVREHFESLFGSENRENAFTNPRIEGEEAPDVSLPKDASAFTAEFDVVISGRTTEELSPDDPRVDADSEEFTSHMKDANTGEILSTSHIATHDCRWWIRPVSTEDEARLEIEQCFHKVWDKRMHGGFECKDENETLVESHRDGDTPSIDSLPDDVLAGLADWFGEPLIRRSLRANGSEMPTKTYECVSCDSVFEVTPRDSCPDCGSESLCEYPSLEKYEEIKEEESDEAAALKEELATAEITTTLDEPE